MWLLWGQKNLICRSMFFWLGYSLQLEDTMSVVTVFVQCFIPVLSHIPSSDNMPFDKFSCQLFTSELRHLWVLQCIACSSCGSFGYTTYIILYYHSNISYSVTTSNWWLSVCMWWSYPFPVPQFIGIDVVPCYLFIVNCPTLEKLLSIVLLQYVLDINWLDFWLVGDTLGINLLTTISTFSCLRCMGSWLSL